MSIAEKLQTVAENQQKVYDAGFTAGQATGGNTDAAYQAGFDAGKQAEYDAFWDVYQDNGNRTDYNNAFFGPGWDDTTFKPKYDIVPTGRDNGGMFSYSSITDIKGILEKQGVKLDLSLCNTETMFTWAHNTKLPVMDYSASTGVSFYYSYLLKSIDKVILKTDGSQLFNFAGANSLQEVVFEGVIGQNMDLSACPLSKASIENVMSVLSDNTTGKTATFKKTAVNNAFTADEWNALVATKPNWTITLA